MVGVFTVNEVAEFLIDYCLRANRKLGTRLPVNCFADRLHHEAGKSECHRHDLLLRRLMERAGRLHSKREIAAQIKQMPRGAAVGLTEEIGKSEPAQYRRLAKLYGP